MAEARKLTAVDTTVEGAFKVKTLGELVALVDERPRLFARFSKGPDHDRTSTSRDHESGLQLPGLSVVPLAPARWWTRPLREWIARQLCKYAHLRTEAPDDRHAWVLTGEIVARGPDNEPLLSPWTPVAMVEDDVVEEARRVYEQRFDVGRDSTSQ
jgi:hypothetical protein